MSRSYMGEKMVLLGYIHIINAVLYIWMWAEVRTVWSLYITPDWINIMNSLIYWTSGWLYAYEYTPAGDQTDVYFFTRKLELFAGLMDLVACFGWIYQWYHEFVTDLAHSPHCTVGRGFTLDDPDVWANLTLLMGAGYYVHYNFSVYTDPSQYETNYMYVLGDFWYLINSVIYLVCSMRDAECFWFMPCNGRLQDYVEMARQHYFSVGTHAGSLGALSLSKDTGRRSSGGGDTEHGMGMGMSEAGSGSSSKKSYSSPPPPGVVQRAVSSSSSSGGGGSGGGGSGGGGGGGGSSGSINGSVGGILGGTGAGAGSLREAGGALGSGVGGASLPLGILNGDSVAGGSGHLAGDIGGSSSTFDSAMAFFVTGMTGWLGTKPDK